jgi:hypothetical protein
LGSSKESIVPVGKSLASQPASTSLRQRDDCGAQYPGGAIELSGGSFGRNAVQLEYGGTSERLDYFAAANFSDDHGWADHNPSRIKQFDERGCESWTHSWASIKVL